MKRAVAILFILAACLGSMSLGEELWVCPDCGMACTGGVCSNCGAAHTGKWVCPDCGTKNEGNVCSKCGRGRYGVGNTVIFGSWAGEPIEWQIMEITAGGTYVLLSVKGLDARPYNTKRDDVTWETCSLRAWLNGEFYEDAFSADEKEKIVFSIVENPGNAKHGTEGGNTTWDRAYLLSLEELNRYYHVDPYKYEKSEALICMPTQKAISSGALTLRAANVPKYQQDYSYPLRAGACWWWLRSPGYTSYDAAYVYVWGNVYLTGDGCDYTDGCVRPVICVRLINGPDILREIRRMRSGLATQGQACTSPGSAVSMEVIRKAEKAHAKT